MAEFLGQSERPSNVVTESAMGNMGKPIPLFRKQNAYDECKAIGMTDPVKITACVGAVSEQLERDKPYEAMSEGMRYLDLTGTYRLFATLLISEDPAFKRQPDAPLKPVKRREPGPKDTEDRMEQYQDYA